MKKTILSGFLALCAISITAQSPTSLKLNLEKGKVYTIRVTNDQNTKFSYNGQDIAVNNKSINVSTFKLLKQVRDTLELEFRFDTITNKTSSPMMNMETNSTKPGKEPQEKIMNKLSRAH